MGSEVDEIVSNYPRGAETRIVTPEIARAVLRVRRSMLLWAFASQFGYVILTVAVRFDIIPSSGFSFGAMSVTVLLSVISADVTSQLKNYFRVLKTEPWRRWPVFVLQLLTLIPVLGFICPFLILRILSNDLRRLATNGGSLRNRQLQAIISSGQEEVLPELNA